MGKYLAARLLADAKCMQLCTGKWLLIEFLQVILMIVIVTWMHGIELFFRHKEYSM